MSFQTSIFLQSFHIFLRFLYSFLVFLRFYSSRPTINFSSWLFPFPPLTLLLFFLLSPFNPFFFSFFVTRFFVSFLLHRHSSSRFLFLSLHSIPSFLFSFAYVVLYLIHSSTPQSSYPFIPSLNHSSHI